jgi:hypothetical protein
MCKMLEPEQDIAMRHPATREKLKRFDYGHLREGLVRNTSIKFASLAIDLIGTLHDGTELTISLDKLREAKDRAVSQAVIDEADQDD